MHNCALRRPAHASRVTPGTRRVVSAQYRRERFASLWDLKDGTIKERHILWDESLRMWKERPFLGHGINTYSKVEPRLSE